VNIGKGFKLINCSAVFLDKNEKPILSVKLIDNKFIISGVFYNEEGKVLLTVKESIFQAHGKDIWDLEINRNGSLLLTNKTQQIYISINQNPDESLDIEGRLWIEGDIFLITSTGIFQPSTQRYMSGCTQINGRGIVLSSTVIIF
jgi:hypothetical protein